MHSPVDVPLVPAELALAGRARELAERFGLPLSVNGGSNLELRLTGQGLELVQTGPDALGPLRIDFIGGPVGHRRRFGGGRGQPLAKAVGLRRGESPSVLDATAGLGRDAFVLATLGCPVTLVERSPVVAALLEDGLARACADGEVGPIITGRMRLVVADALAYMAKLPPDARPDVVYLDPMYPPREKSALVKKEMRLLQAVLGEQEDAGSLLVQALATARRRVVVKRPAYAGPLAGIEPTFSLPTKKNRFDVYVAAARGG